MNNSKIRLIGLSLAMAALAGCVAKLSDEGRFIRQIVPDLANECEFLGVVDAAEGSGWDKANDRIGALNILRNQISLMNGNAFVLTDISSSDSKTLIQADAYKCAARK